MPLMRPVWFFAGMIAACGLARAATDLAELHLSADIHFTLPAGGGANLVGRDDTIAVLDVASGVADGVQFLGTLDASDIDAYHASDACGASLFSLNATAEVGSSTPTVMRPADVFRDVGLKVLDANAAGIADGVDVDAVSRDPATCELVLSFDTTVELAGTVYRPADLVRFSGGAFSLFRAGPSNANVDAVHVLDTGAVLASFAAPVPDLGFAFADEDIVEQPDGGGSWELAFQPATIDASWKPADTDALFVVRGPIAGDFRWQNADVQVPEDQSTFQLTIERVGFTEGPLTVSWSTADGTATSGVDFGGASGGIAFSDGQTTANVSLTLFDNGSVDGDKTFFVDLTAATNGGNIVSPSRATVLIRDDEDFLFADGFES